MPASNPANMVKQINLEPSSRSESVLAATTAWIIKKSQQMARIIKRAVLDGASYDAPAVVASPETTQI